MNSLRLNPIGLLLILCVFLPICGNAKDSSDKGFTFSKTDTGVEIALGLDGSARILRLEAKTPKVIRMTATMNPSSDKARSLSL